MNTAAFRFGGTMKISIFRREFMAVNTMGSSSVDARTGVTSFVVLSMRNGLKMTGLYAKIVFARVVNFKASGYRTIEKLIRKSVSVAIFRIKPKIAVSSFFVSPTGCSSNPKPAIFFASNFNLKPKSFYFTHDFGAYTSNRGKAICM
jgi:hypothetical protein